MRPRKYPYSGKTKIVRKEMPNFIVLGYAAFEIGLIKHIQEMRQVGENETLIICKIPRLFTYEEKQIRVCLTLSQVVEILNQY